MTDAIVLAAGESIRFGAANKLLTNVYSKPLILHVVNEICKSEIENIYVISGRDHKKINEILNKSRVKVIKNNNQNDGINSSLSFGVKNLEKKSSSVMICLADMPLLRTEDYNNILNFEKNKGNASSIIVPFNNGRRGNPVIFGCHFYNELLLLKGDEGGKKIIDKNKMNLVKFLSKSKGYFFDIDIQSDILKLNSQ